MIKHFDNLCKHCYYVMNYNEEYRLEFDVDETDNGYGIAKYIIECHKDHDCKNCLRKQECYLCNFKQRKQINNMLNPDLLKDLLSDDEDELISIPLTKEQINDNEYKCEIKRGLKKGKEFKIPKKIVI